MEGVYDLHQYTHCVIMHIGKNYVATNIFLTSRRHFSYISDGELIPDSSISYDKQTGNVRDIDYNRDEEDEDTIVITNFYDKLYALFKKDKETWNEEDIFLMKAVSDYLPIAMKHNMKARDLKKKH
ncbi:hypothetical protein EDC94DRAFT_659090 [Helicostylum pulchrum]|nr:hypothetical protein EDC94DRAFT_659090 [Helicostylum pulchrum]